MQRSAGFPSRFLPLACLLLCAAVAGPLFAQCAGGVCRPRPFLQSGFGIPSFAPAAPARDAYTGWGERDDGTLVRYVNGVEVERFTKKAESEPVKEEPVGQPIGQVISDGIPNYGLRADKLSQGRDRLWSGSQEVDPNRYYADAPPDDLAKPHVAVIGDEGYLQQARAAFAGPELSKYTGRVHVTYNKPSDWQVAGVGLNRNGVTILGPRDANDKAMAVHYQADLVGLDKALEQALREPDKNFDPAKTPDLRSPTPAIPGLGESIPKLLSFLQNNWLAVAIAAAAAFYVYRSRQKQPTVIQGLLGKVRSGVASVTPKNGKSTGSALVVLNLLGWLLMSGQGSTVLDRIKAALRKWLESNPVNSPAPAPANAEGV